MNNSKFLDFHSQTRVCEYCSRFTPLTGKYCQFCGKEISFENDFNNPLLRKCSFCNRFISSDSLYCCHCGSDLPPFYDETYHGDDWEIGFDYYINHTGYRFDLDTKEKLLRLAQFEKEYTDLLEEEASRGIMYGTIEQDDLEREYAELMKYEKLNRIIAAVHADKPIYFGGFGLDIDDSYEIEKYEAEWLNYVEMHFVD